MKSILFVIDENRKGGVSVVLEDIICTLSKEKCKIDLLVLHDQNEMLKNLPDNVSVIYGTPYFKAVDYSLKQLIKEKNIKLILKKLRIIFELKTGFIGKTIKRERRKILKNSYDIEVAFKDGFTAFFVAYGDSRNKVHWLHSEYKEKNSNSNYNRMFKKILPEFDSIVAVSKGVEDQFNSIYHLEGKTEVVRNIVSPAVILEKASVDIEGVFNSDDINVVLVGRCHSDKGYDRFLNVVNELNEKDLLDSLKFHIIGDGPEKHRLCEYVRFHKLQDRVVFHGRLDNPYQYIKQADCLMLPSRNESFGLVIVEAQILGTPVIATDNAATREIVAHNKDGVIVTNSKKGIREGILIAKNRDKLKIYKENLAEYRYDNDKSISQIKRILGV